MSVTTVPPPSSDRYAVPPEPVLPLTVQQYHEMVRARILVDGDPIELLEGWLVRKMTKDPPHTLAVGCTHDLLGQMVGPNWHVRIEGPITTGDSEPEPDGSIVRGHRRDFADRHPGPSDVGLLVEVASASLDRDRGWKTRIYAAAEVPVYWIVNLIDRQVEVLSEPTGPGDEPGYSVRQVFQAGDTIPVILEGNQVGRIAVDDLLP
jgi:Uma2 family endonuclease